MSRYAKNKMSNWVAGIAVHRNARAIFITLLVALFMVTTGALPALAGDGKVYPGSMGVRYSGTFTPTYNCSAIGNPSATQHLYLDLPIIKDVIGGHINKSWVRVTDRHRYSSISCAVCNRYRCGFGWCGQTKTKYSSGWSGWGEQLLNTGAIGTNKNTREHYYFSCRIPPKYYNKISYINSYYAEESY